MHLPHPARPYAGQETVVTQAGRPARARRALPSRPRTGCGQVMPRPARCSISPEEPGQLRRVHALFVERQDEVPGRGAQGEVAVLDPLGDAAEGHHRAQLIAFQEQGERLVRDLGVNRHPLLSRFRNAWSRAAPESGRHPWCQRARTAAMRQSGVRGQAVQDSGAGSLKMTSSSVTRRSSIPSGSGRLGGSASPAPAPRGRRRRQSGPGSFTPFISDQSRSRARGDQHGAGSAGPARRLRAGAGSCWSSGCRSRSPGSQSGATAFTRRLAVGGGVADILPLRPLDLWEPGAQDGPRSRPCRPRTASSG